MLDSYGIRAEFPGLDTDMVFMDNAGGSQTLRRVVDRIGDFLLTSNVQLGASYATSVKAGERVLESRVRAATLVNAARPEEIVMGGSSTALLRMLVQGLTPLFAPGDELIVTNLDHEANIGAWLALAERGVVIRFWTVNRDTLRLEIADLQLLLGARTRMLALTYASNVLGGITPVPEAVRLARSVGAMVCVDGVAYAPHRAIDVQALDVDFYVFSYYKLFGPHYAMLYGKYQHLLRMANLNHGFIAADDVPYKLQPGNQNYELGWGATAISDYLADLGAGLGADVGVSLGADLGPSLGEAGDERACIVSAYAGIAGHEAALSAHLLSYLGSRNTVTIQGDPTADPDRRVSTISFTVRGKLSEDVVRAVDRHGIGIRFGDFYAKRLIDALGLRPQGGVIRVSMVHYNTLDEVDRLMRALDEAF